MIREALQLFDAVLVFSDKAARANQDANLRQATEKVKKTDPRVPLTIAAVKQIAAAAPGGILTDMSADAGGAREITRRLAGGVAGGQQVGAAAKAIGQATAEAMAKVQPAEVPAWVNPLAGNDDLTLGRGVGGRGKHRGGGFYGPGEVELQLGGALDSARKTKRHGGWFSEQVIDPFGILTPKPSAPPTPLPYRGDEEPADILPLPQGQAAAPPVHYQGGLAEHMRRMLTVDTTKGGKPAGPGGFAGMVQSLLGAPSAGQARAGQMAMAAGASPGMGAGITAAAQIGGLVALPAALIKLNQAVARLPWQIEQFGTSIMEATRHLRIYNAQINATFARQEYQERQLGAKTAQTVGPSSELLGENLMQLRRDLQPFNAGWQKAMNYLAIIATSSAQQALPVLMAATGMTQLVLAVNRIEQFLNIHKPRTTTPPLVDHLQKIARNEWGQPRNQRPDKAAAKGGGE